MMNHPFLARTHGNFLPFLVPTHGNFLPFLVPTHGVLLLSFLLALSVTTPASRAHAQADDGAPTEKKKSDEGEKADKKDAAKNDEKDAAAKEEKKDAAKNEKKDAEKKEDANEKKKAEGDDEDAKKDGESGDGTKEKEKPKPKKRKKPKPPPIFFTYDGNRIGGVPDLESITVQTAYGALVVPKEDLVRIRFAKEKDPKLEEKIATEIERLKSEEFEIREEATKKLREFGAPALKLLQKATKSDDEEVKNRAQTLIKLIEEEDELYEIPENENEAPITGDDDEVVTVSFVIRGRVKETTFSVKSSYGRFQVHRRDLISVVFQEFSPTDVEFLVPGSFFAPQNKWYESKIALVRGDRLQITARGSIQLHNYGWTVGPEGTTRIGGNHFKNFPIASLVGRIGKKGKPFLVGSAYKGLAKASGKIQFAVAYRGGTVSGNFNVKIQLRRLTEEGDEEEVAEGDKK